MAGGTGLEPATDGFGDRYSTIELPTYNHSRISKFSHFVNIL